MASVANEVADEDASSPQPLPPPPQPPPPPPYAPTQPVYAARPRVRRPRASNAVVFFAILPLVVVLVLSEACLVRFVFVDMDSVYLTPNLSKPEIGYYNRPGSPAVNPSTVTRYSFHWFIDASNRVLDPLPIFYIPFTFLLVMVFGFQTFEVTLFTPVFILLFLTQLAKVAYYGLYLFSLFGLQCREHGLCVNRDTSIDANKPDITFVVTSICALVIAATTLVALFIPRAFAKALRARPNVSYSQPMVIGSQQGRAGRNSGKSTTAAAAAPAATISPLPSGLTQRLTFPSQ